MFRYQNVIRNMMVTSIFDAPDDENPRYFLWDCGFYTNIRTCIDIQCISNLQLRKNTMVRILNALIWLELLVKLQGLFHLLKTRATNSTQMKNMIRMRILDQNDPKNTAGAGSESGFQYIYINFSKSLFIYNFEEGGELCNVFRLT